MYKETSNSNEIQLDIIYFKQLRKFWYSIRNESPLHKKHKTKLCYFIDLLIKTKPAANMGELNVVNKLPNLLNHTFLSTLYQTNHILCMSRSSF